MNKTIKCALLFAAGITSLPAVAHISYSSRDFGIYDSTTGGSNTILHQFVTGNYGWIDGTDSDQGNSHGVLPFRFTLTSSASVNLSFREDSAMTTNYKGEEALSMLGLTPGFSLYRGLAHVSPHELDHDNTDGSKLLRPEGSEGSFVALADWSITNEDDPQALDPSYLSYIGHAYDGAMNYGTGLIPGGDGVADNFVSKTFQLDPGDYSVFAGGSSYWDQLEDNPNLAARYGLNASFSIMQQVPEPGTYTLLLIGLGLLSIVKRRRQVY
ncbi:PEP-CTERM sorting domain-containing protein [Nitrosomonas eutropha]|uniref:Secreted protein with PEP-CTERM sorting signal n=2 Tax=Nitrosomonas eutropha TaxID=916 RepID=A0ABX5M4W4_9PROT|nr:PEP-CTERM sorting domain-containing protein [Nitrosomonas eutropha]ABI60152.1 PEP motif putative anchor-like protein [Nitrosomonas eutropha C91]PXV77574.1 putative secreted protein with PEP-CTERM sorting signal [Nitrosomonas eutropha]SCX14987.1 PEP-CTERM protein-sorting domain-containing protein [Nitrosomonas eutropha]